MRGLLALLLLLLVFLAGQRPAFAQSDDLDFLFAQLRQPGTAAMEMRIEERIWNQWMHGGSTAENDALARATQAMNSANAAEAERQLNALIRQTQSFPEAYNKRATLYFMIGRYDESLSDIASTLELEPRHFGALSGRGMILQRLGRDAEAIAAYKEALAINPNLEGAKSAVRLLEIQAPGL